jgi:hypothetical protein
MNDKSGYDSVTTGMNGLNVGELRDEEIRHIDCVRNAATLRWALPARGRRRRDCRLAHIAPDE